MSETEDGWKGKEENSTAGREREELNGACRGRLPEHGSRRLVQLTLDGLPTGGGRSRGGGRTDAIGGSTIEDLVQELIAIQDIEKRKGEKAAEEEMCKRLRISFEEWEREKRANAKRLDEEANNGIPYHQEKLKWEERRRDIYTRKEGESVEDHLKRTEEWEKLQERERVERGYLHF